MDTLGQGLDLKRQGKPSEAAALLEQAARDGREPYEAWTNLSDVRLQLGDKQGALAAAEQALEAGPDGAGAWMMKGYALRALDRPDEALLACGRAIDLDPDRGDVHLCRGEVLADLGRHDEAICEFDRALDTDPTWLEALVLKAQSLVSQEQYPEALKVADRMMAITPDFAAGWGVRAICRYNQGALGPAELAIDRAIAAGGEDGDGLVLKAAIADSLGRHREATTLIARAARIDPDNEAAREGVADLGRRWAEATRIERQPMSIAQRVRHTLWHLHEERPSLSAALTMGLGSSVLLIGLIATVASIGAGGSPGAGILIVLIGAAIVAPAAYAGQQTRWFHEWQHLPTERGYLVSEHEIARRTGPLCLLAGFFAFMAWIWALMWTTRIIAAVTSRR